MRIPFVDLAAQYRSIKGEIDPAIGRVLERGRFVLGPEGAEFENEFAAYTGSAHAAAVGSGTDALHLALVALGVGPGDEVITVPNISAPTIAAICMAGASPVLVDIDPETYNMAPAALEACLKARAGRKIKAVVPVHLYGHPADMDPIMEIARAHNLVVVEDACQAHGALYKGRKVGTLGHAGCFSFYPTKNLGAMGDGGMVATGDAAVAERVRMLRNYGEDARYHNAIKGFNSRLDELQAAVLRVKLKRLEGWNERRRALAALYAERLAGVGCVLPVERPYAGHVYHLYVVRVKDRDKVRERLIEQGVATGVHYPVPIHLQPAYEDLGYRAGDFPHAEIACRDVLSLPIYPELGEDGVEGVCRALREVL